MGRMASALLLCGGIAVGYIAAAWMRTPVALAADGPSASTTSVDPTLIHFNERTTIDERGTEEVFANYYHFQANPSGECMFEFYFVRPNPADEEKVFKDKRLVAKLKARVVMTDDMARKFSTDISHIPAFLDNLARHGRGATSQPSAFQ